MDIDITLKNYRCFEDSSPAKFKMGRSFVGFVGPNNSGKSSILRFFYEFRDLFQQFGGNPAEIQLAFRNHPRPFTLGGLLDINEVFCKFNNRDLEIEFEIHGPQSHTDPTSSVLPSKIVAKILRGTRNFTLQLEVNSKSVDTSQAVMTGSMLSSSEMSIDLSSYYEAFKSLSSTTYIPAFRNIINLGANDSYYDISVGQAFVTAWRHLKTGDRRKENESAAEVTDLIQQIFNYDKLDINASENGQTILVMIDGKAYGLHEQGAGFAQFVLCLINAAIQQPSFVLIDEPELGLHASLHLRFLTTLGTFAQEGVLFATHSMGLARTAGELVYSLHRNSNGNSELHDLGNEPRLPELLGELSFSGYRELGFDSILLVEGVTDIKWMHEILRKFGKDGQVVVLPLGGDQLIRDGVEAELEEIKRISENIYALIDSEKAAPEDALEPTREKFVELCDRVGIRCQVLERRATENYLSEHAIQKVFGDKYRALAPYESLKDVEFGWAKADNWKIARSMELEEFRETDLGRFIESI